ncbi:MAG: hypothetical protein R2795_05540 [Saprospiraceae bacterium]
MDRYGGGQQLSGTYGQLVTTAPIAVGTAPIVSINVQDTEDSACTATRSVTVPTECLPDPCSMESGVVTQGACNG